MSVWQVRSTSSRYRAQEIRHFCAKLVALRYPPHPSIRKTTKMTSDKEVNLILDAFPWIAFVYFCFFTAMQKMQLLLSCRLLSIHLFSVWKITGPFVIFQLKTKRFKMIVNKHWQALKRLKSEILTISFPRIRSKCLCIGKLCEGSWKTEFALFAVGHCQTVCITTGLPSSLRAVNIYDIA